MAEITFDDFLDGRATQTTPAGSDLILSKKSGQTTKKITSSAFGVYKNTVTTTAPTVDDDSDEGYSVGSRWFNTTTEILYIAEDVTIGAAVWTATSSTVDEDQIYYVGKHGNDSNSGKSIGKAFLTFGAAITAAQAQTPSSSNIFTIKCLDSGVYTENITSKEWVNIDAPNVTINGYVELRDNSTNKIHRVENSSNHCIYKPLVTGSGITYLDVDELECSSNLKSALANFGASNLGQGTLIAKVGKIKVTSGAIAVGDYNASNYTGITRAYIDYIELAANSSWGICANDTLDSNSLTEIIVNSISTIGFINCTAIWIRSGATASITINKAVGLTTAYQVDSGGTLYYTANKHQGTETNNGTVVSFKSNEATTKGDVLFFDGSKYVRLGVGTDGQVIEADSTQTLGVKWVTPSGGGGGGDFEVSMPAGSFDLPSSNFAPWETDAGTNGNLRGHLFDDTTEEFVEAQFTLPSAIAGTVTIEAYGYSATAAASKNIELKLYHSAKADAENWDAAFSTKESGDLATDSTQDNLERHTFTETVATLGWTANDQVRIKLSRIAPSANNLSGDWILTHLRIIVPRS